MTLYFIYISILINYINQLLQSIITFITNNYYIYFNQLLHLLQSIITFISINYYTNISCISLYKDFFVLFF